MSIDPAKGFYLRELRVDPRRGEVTGRSRSLHLPPKAMKVLVCLAANSGKLVSHEELLQAAWAPGKGSREMLSHTVGEIRQALGDHPDDPEYIRTVPRRGYQLLVEASAHPHPENGPTLATPPVDAGLLGIIDNLRQRGVIETAIAYSVLGWLILQVADVLFDQLHLPAWVGTFVTVLVIAGFPIALVLSWFLEFRHGRAVRHELSPPDAKRKQFSRTYLSVIGAMALAAVGVYVYDRNVGLPEPEPDLALTASAEEIDVLPPVLDNSIAVLPFYNLDGSDETRIFSEGLVDDVITRLSRVPGLLVSSRGDAFTLEPNSASQRVRERLRVALYLEGSVQIKGDRMRIIVQLIDSETGFHVLSRSFDRGREDFFDIRDEITELTVANVRVALPPETQAATSVSRDDPSLDVYLLYRRGVEASRLPLTAQTIEQTLEFYDQALAIDPGYAAAHAGRCSILAKGYPTTDDAAFITRAEAACARALALNPNLDVVHTALGKLYETTGRYADAESAHLAALEINPKSVSSLTGLGTIYMLQGRASEAEDRFTQAIGLYPGNWNAYAALGMFFFQSGRYLEAASQYEIVVALNRKNSTGFSNLGAAYMMAGDFSLAAPAFSSAIDLDPRPTTYSNLGLMYYYLGQLNASVDAHSRSVALAPNDHLVWSNLGDALWVTGRREEALEAFDTAKSLASTALEVNPNDPGFLMDMAWILTMLGEQTDAASLIEKARLQAPDDPYVHYIKALMLMRSGQQDETLSVLQTAADKGYPRQMIAADPYLIRLRDNPEFQSIARKSNHR